MDRRGFIKTLEAVLSVIIVFIFIFTISQRGTNDGGDVETMKNIQEGLLMGVNQNDDFRSCIVTTNDANLNLIASGDVCPEIKQYVMDTLPSRFAKESNERFVIQVCNPSCLLVCQESTHIPVQLS
jgi:hypothetical protein